jgi:hypothetical protein
MKKTTRKQRQKRSKPEVASVDIPPCLTSASTPAGIARRMGLCLCGRPGAMATHLLRSGLKVCQRCFDADMKFGIRPAKDRQP